MKKTSTSKIGMFTRFLWFVSGADIETLSMCPIDYKKFEAIGMTIFMTALVGFASGSSAAWYFTGDIRWTFLFGVFWSLLIFSIDRSLVVTLKKDPYDTSKKRFIWPILSRAVLAALVAGIMSIPLELLVFNGFIENDIESYKSDLLKQQNEDSFNTQQAAEYESKSKSLDLSLQKTGSKVESCEEKLNNKRNERRNEAAKLNHPATTAYNNAQSAVNNLQRQLNQLYNLPGNDYRRNNIPSLRNKIAGQKGIMANERGAWNNKINARLATLDSEIIQLEENLNSAKETYARTEKEKERVDSTTISYQTKASESIGRTEERFDNGNNFTLYYGVLMHALYKKHTVKRERTLQNGNKVVDTVEEYENAEFIFLLWLIRAVFFVIEILPTIVKVVAKPGQYELRLHHQEEELKKYLQSQEYRDYCYHILHDDNKLKLELQKERHDAEKKVQQQIIQAIMDAEESVAQDSIDNWEKIEKGKLRGQYPSMPATI